MLLSVFPRGTALPANYPALESPRGLSTLRSSTCISRISRHGKTCRGLETMWDRRSVPIPAHLFIISWGHSTRSVEDSTTVVYTLYRVQVDHVDGRLPARAPNQTPQYHSEGMDCQSRGTTRRVSDRTANIAGCCGRPAVRPGINLTYSYIRSIEPSAHYGGPSHRTVDGPAWEHRLSRLPGFCGT